MRIASRLLWIVSRVALMGAVGCSSGGQAPSFTPAADQPANVRLYLSNQSAARRSVTLAVYVDGRLAVSKEMASVFKPAAAHDFPEEFPLRLAPGPHTIKVVAEGQVATASTEIVVGAGTLYVGADYFWSPGSRNEARIPEKIVLTVQAKPFGFC